MFQATAEGSSGDRIMLHMLQSRLLLLDRLRRRLRRLFPRCRRFGGLVSARRLAHAGDQRFCVDL